MSSKRKWDQPAPEEGSTSAKPDDSKSASDAAAAAAAIAAKIAAQFAGGGLGGLSGMKDPHDGDFTKDIDINDVRNRYMLTKGSTQAQINEETGASVSTKGIWYPDRSKATDKDPPLYLHISASSQEMLDNAVEKINELIAVDLGPLVEDKKDRLREKRKWPEEKLPVALESIRNFNVRAKVVGPSGMFVKYIQQETSTRVQIKGLGSGFVDQETGKEAEEPMHIHITGPDEAQVARAKVLTEDLLEVVRSEHAKMATMVSQQQMELHHAQAQYAVYNTMSGYAPPPPSNAPPPPPPGEQPPPPPDGSTQTGAEGYAGAPPPPGSDAASHDAYAQYWAAYGYDVNSPQFKEWAAQQQQQYSQYYAQQGYSVDPSQAGAAAAPAPTGAAPPPPPA
ncbi:KH domain containing protein RIK/BLOM7 [Pleurotus pulmonarius]